MPTDSENLMNQLASLQLSPNNGMPNVLALNQHFQHLDTVQRQVDTRQPVYGNTFSQIHRQPDTRQPVYGNTFSQMQRQPDILQTYFQEAFVNEVRAKVCYRQQNNLGAMQFIVAALRTYTSMRSHAKTTIEIGKVDALIHACKELQTVFLASSDVAHIFNRLTSDMTTSLATLAMTNMDRLDCGIEIYNRNLEMRANNAMELSNWGGILHRSKKDQWVVDTLKNQFGVFPHVEKFDADRGVMR